MEILKRGSPGNKIWIGRTIECDLCKGKFRLNARDKVVETTPNQSHQIERYFKIKCPTPGCRDIHFNSTSLRARQ